MKIEKWFDYFGWFWRIPLNKERTKGIMFGFNRGLNLGIMFEVDWEKDLKCITFHLMNFGLRYFPECDWR